jgi:large subunit ribosomal protein L21
MAEKKTKKAIENPTQFAVIETGGKQYVVSTGSVIKVEKLEKPAKGSALTFDKVLLLNDGEKTTLGAPYISGKKVEAELVREGSNKKVVVFKYKSKTRYRIKTGHRQQFTEVKITKV